MSVEVIRTARCKVVKAPRCKIPEWIFSKNEGFLFLIEDLIENYIESLEDYVYHDRNIIITESAIYIFMDAYNNSRVIKWVSKMINMTK